MQIKSKNMNFVAIGLAIFLMIFGIWNVGWVENVYAEDIIPEFAGGDGTVGTPYQITKLEHLNNVRDHLDKHFILMNDLDFANDADYEQIQNKPSGQLERVGYL